MAWRERAMTNSQLPHVQAPAAGAVSMSGFEIKRVLLDHACIPQLALYGSLPIVCYIVDSSRGLYMTYLHVG